MICLAGPITDEGKPINLNGSGSKTKIIVAKTVPFNEASPPIMTMHKIGISCIKVNEDGSIKVI